MPEREDYENNPLRHAFEREADRMADDEALRQEGEDIADMIGVGGSSDGDSLAEVLSVLREILEVQKQARVEANQRLEEIRSAVENAESGSGSWG